MPTELELAWAGGLFDGEGCVSIGYVPPSQRQRIMNPSYRLTVKVTMCDKRTIEKFGALMGTGSFQRHVYKTKKWNASYSWVAMSRKAEDILKLLRPFLVTKAEEADIGLEFMALPLARRGGNGGCKPMDPELLQKRHDLFLRCAKLKGRWRWRKQRPGQKPEAPRESKWQMRRHTYPIAKTGRSLTPGSADF